MFYNQFKPTVEFFGHFFSTIGQGLDFVAAFKDSDHSDHPRDLLLLGDGDEVRQWIKDSTQYHNRLKAMSQERTVAMIYLQKVD